MKYLLVFHGKKKSVPRTRLNVILYVHRLSCFAYGTKTFARITLHLLCERVIFFIKQFIYGVGEAILCHCMIRETQPLQSRDLVPRNRVL
jgi:hypothetical protein